MRKRGSVFLKRGSKIVYMSPLAFCASAKTDQDCALNGLKVRDTKIFKKNKTMQ